MSDFMFEDVDAEVVVSEILMLRTDPDKAMFIVEGGADEKFLYQYIDQDSCEIIIAEGKKNALEAISIAEAEGMAGILCLVDRDYDDFLGIDFSGNNVIVTDLHDIEQILLHSTAFRKVLNEIGSKDKIEKVERGGRDVLSILFESAHPLGKLRFISLRDNLNLKFKKMSYRSFDRKTVVPDLTKMCQDVINNSKAQFSCRELLDLISNFNDPHDVRMMCSGHDLTEIFGKSLISLIGSKDAIFVTRNEIESRLRLAFDKEQFMKTTIYKLLVDWESRNPPYLVLLN